MKNVSKAAAIALLMASGSSVLAEQADAPQVASAQAGGFEKFVPSNDRSDIKIDYSIWDEALENLVISMGNSDRKGVRRPDASLGSRMVYGHDSLLRLEGNRVAFSFLNEAIVASLTEYRQDLERTADLVDISKLSRNEQLSYWLNLHNVAVMEQVALAYPVRQPSLVKLGDAGTPIDETKFLTVAGVKMSPRDIRTRIVYPNWSDPVVMYGFFRGDIGGPSIERQAYKADMVKALLDGSADEFINSLRGTQKRGDALWVSEIYEEARPFYFPNWPDDLRTHLQTYSGEAVDEILATTTGAEARIYENDIADLAGGERQPTYNTILSGDYAQSIRIPPAVARLMTERQQKFEKMIRRGERTGRVYVIPVDLPGEESKSEVK